MLAAANAAVPRIQAADLQNLISGGNVLIVDVRDAPELAAGGKVKGAINVSRGMLEFRADPESKSRSQSRPFRKTKRLSSTVPRVADPRWAEKCFKSLGTNRYTTQVHSRTWLKLVWRRNQLRTCRSVVQFCLVSCPQPPLSHAPG